MGIGGVVDNFFGDCGKDITETFGIPYPVVPIARLLSTVIATVLLQEAEHGFGMYSGQP